MNGNLLDVGGGTGRVSSAMSDFVKEIVVTDISLGMLRQAPRIGVGPVCGGSESLPFAGESFDRIIMVDALHHVIDPAKTAREMYRVLKPGGRLVIEEPDIRTFGVKLIALAEKLLMMRSRFLAPPEISSLFEKGSSSVRTTDSTTWVIIEKPVTPLVRPV